MSKADEVNLIGFTTDETKELMSKCMEQVSTEDIVEVIIETVDTNEIEVINSKLEYYLDDQAGDEE